jgi:3',5'-cyclic AMP phosphodiesterase CpdA
MIFPRLVVGLACILLLGSCGDGWQIQQAAKNTDSALRLEPSKEVSTNILGDPYFIQVSDVHFDSSATTIDYGYDTGGELWTKTKVKLAEIIGQNPAPKFIVYTGDLPAHYGCDKTCFIPPDQRTTHSNNIAKILVDLRQIVDGTGIPLLIVPGNNDSLAGDYYSFADRKNETLLSLAADLENVYPALNSTQGCGNTPCIVSNPHPQMGYYSARPIDGLRVIALNSIIFGQRYHQVDGVKQVDAGNTQMSWLRTELAAARLSGEKVHIIMHIPPGKNAYAVAHGKTPTQMWAELPWSGNNWLNQFLSLVEEYQSEITGILSGHTHMDEVRRLYDVDGTKITEVAVSAPGVTPIHNNNPGIKVYWYNSSTKELLDFETHYTTPTALSWGRQRYRFSTIFQCDANSTIYQCLSDGSLTDVNEAMDTIFTVMNGAPSYKTMSGIEVKAE